MEINVRINHIDGGQTAKVVTSLEDLFALYVLAEGNQIDMPITEKADYYDIWITVVVRPVTEE